VALGCSHILDNSEHLDKACSVLNHEIDIFIQDDSDPLVFLLAIIRARHITPHYAVTIVI